MAIEKNDLYQASLHFVVFFSALNRAKSDKKTKEKKTTTTTTMVLSDKEKWRKKKYAHHDIKRKQHGNCYKKIGKCQTDNEPIGDCLKGPFPVDASQKRTKKEKTSPSYQHECRQGEWIK